MKFSNVGQMRLSRVFFVFIELRWAMIVRFVDVDHHCLNVFKKNKKNKKTFFS